MAPGSEGASDNAAGDIADHTIDRTPEYEEFMSTLRAYHEKRGTSFEPEPKVGSVHLDMLKVYKHIVAAGGYDKVSNEKLAWRTMATELGLSPTHNPASIAFALKSAFYKYLAAYEITTVHKKEPPPPSILEHLTAKGGNLLGRTLENYASRRDAGSLNASGNSDNDGTPARERRTDETPTSGRASRGLREAPAQRVIFQPDTGPTRQPRSHHASSSAQHSHAHSPSASANASPAAARTQHAQQQPQQQQQQQHPHTPGLAPHGQQMHPHTPHHLLQPRGPSVTYNPQNPETTSTLVQSFEPRVNIPQFPMQPVDTPSNNPAKFAQRRQQERLLAAGHIQGQLPIRAPPGVNTFEGPNIYMRCLSALRSGIFAEQGYALHHFVKISFERGDKFRFENFAGLAEGLIEKGLEVGPLFYDVKWSIDYSGEADESAIGELDGLYGTSDILERIAQLRPKEVQETILPPEFVDRLGQIIEAVLTVRNMVTLPENAHHMSDCPPLKDLLCIIIHLPNHESLVELKHLALDIAEQLTPFLSLDAEDPLYRSLLAQLDSTDRGTILTSLRAIARISMNLAETNRLGNVPPEVLQHIQDWLLLNDDELMDACLDFLYQYTAVLANVETLLRSLNASHLVSHLVRLLSHGARRTQKETILEPETKIPATEEVQQLPEDLRQQLVAIEEPERCYAWLKCLFEEDPDSHITQIAIWQAYTKAFSGPMQQMSRPMLGAAEFIRNVSHVFHSAGAQIVREKSVNGTEVQRFIIKGVRTRMRPVGLDGREYFPCMWRTPTAHNPAERVGCPLHFGAAEPLWQHILRDHLNERAAGEEQDGGGKFPNKERDLMCCWAGCTVHPAPPRRQDLWRFMAHVKTHCVAAEQKAAATSTANGGVISGNGEGSANGGGGGSSRRSKKSFIVPAKTITIGYEETMSVREERTGHPQPAGIPLSAALVLRNIARNVAKVEVEPEDADGSVTGGGGGNEEDTWLERLFRPVSTRLNEIMIENRLLAQYVIQILDIYRNAEARWDRN